MKKMLTLAFAALLLSGCGKGDLKSQLLDKMKDCTEAIEKAENEKDIEEAGKEFKDFCKENEKELEESKLQKDKDVQKALLDMTTVSFKKAMELKMKK